MIGILIGSFTSVLICLIILGICYLDYKREISNGRAESYSTGYKKGQDSFRKYKDFYEKVAGLTEELS